MDGFSPAPSRSAWTLPAACALLLVFALLATRLARESSATFDEPGLIVAGCSYLAPGASEIATGNLRLVPLALAAPLLSLHPELPAVLRENRPLLTGVDPALGCELLADERNPGVTLLRRSRAVVTVFGALLGAIVFRWSRRLHGDAAGLFSLALFVFNPVVLSNSALATTDIATTLAFTVATAAWWWLWHGITLPRVFAAGIAAGLLATTKISGLLFAPIVVGLLIVRLLSLQPLAVGWWRAGRPVARARTGLALAGAMVAGGAIAYATLWAVYGFRYAPPTPIPAEAWPAITSDLPVGRQVVLWLHQYRLLPEAMLVDLYAFVGSGGTRRAFLLGQHSLEGWWYFFPVVWFFKTPLAQLVALGGALITAVLAWRRRHSSSGEASLARYGLAPLLVLAGIYGLVALAARLNIGVRHLLPVYPALFVFAGVLAEAPWLRRPARAVACVLLVGWSAFDVWRVFPHELAFVNEFGGGTRRGYRVVVDSSYEWGGDLPAFERWLAARRATPAGARPVFFSYFGNADLRRFQGEVTLLPQFFDLRLATMYPLVPGTYVLSATMLQGVYGLALGPWRPSLEAEYQRLTREMRRLEPVRGDAATARRFIAETGGENHWAAQIRLYDALRLARLCAWLRQREPSGRITPGLLVYELGPEDLRAALLDAPVELVAGEAIKGARRVDPKKIDFVP